MDIGPPGAHCVGASGRGRHGLERIHIMGEQNKDETPQTNETNAESSNAQEPTAPENQVSVEDIGTLKKKVRVTVPRERIDAKQNELFGELSSRAQVPGFRIGRAPRRLLEKRFGKDVAQDVRNALLGDSIGEAVEKTELKTLGEPDLDIESIELPDEGDLEFSFDVEVGPEFELPELKGIHVEKPALEITDQRVDEEMERWKATRARFEESDTPAAEGDIVTAGATIRIDGIDEPVESPGLTLRVAPGQIEGLPIVDLGEALSGKKSGQTAKLKVTVPDAHPNTEWAGKEAAIEIHVSQVRRRVLPEIDEEFAASIGFDSLQDLREVISK
ncbi:MAG: trigger factor, partial [Planctomycetota bacterium]